MSEAPEGGCCSSTNTTLPTEPQTFIPIYCFWAKPIPPKRNRKVQRPYDQQLYRERNHIERLFGRLKQCRRIATRYDKTVRNFLAFLHLAATMILLA